MNEELTRKTAELDERKSLYNELGARIAEIKREIQNLNSQRGSKKSERQTLLSYGQDVWQITRAIAEIDVALEEKEDAIVGIEARLPEIKAEIESIENEIYNINGNLQKQRLIEVSKKYNKKAEELGKILRDFWDLYDSLSHKKGFTPCVYCDNFYESAMNKVPVLKFAGSDPSKGDYFFDIFFYRNHERYKNSK